MGVRDFDVARHQPHPPGYPVFIALAKMTTAAASALGVESPEIAGLAFWGAAGGAVLLIAIFVFVRALFRDDLVATIAMLLTGASPLLWFTALRPLSDVAGLGAAGLALAGLAVAMSRDGEWDRQRVALLCGAACLAGISIGFRSQMAVLTLPFLGWVLITSRPRPRLGVAMFAIAALAVGGLAWALPLIVVSGGPDAYLQALGSQAGEDFAGVVMLWTNRTPRVAVFAALNTFMLPWDSPVLAGVMLSLAAAGCCWCVVRRFSRALVLAVVFGPYLVFHLLFQETLTTRYALPLVLPVAICAALTIAQAGRPVALGATGALVVAALAFGVPAGAAFSRIESPFTAAMAEMKLLRPTDDGRRTSDDGRRTTVVGMHRRVWSESRRARPWYGPMPGRALETPRDYEWLELTRTWLAGEEGDVWFLADPRRTDLALIDSEHRRTREYRWPFDSRVYVGGARPDNIDWHIYPQPGWFLERGWALTPETAGITERDGFGPHRRPSIGWIRRRSNATLMMLGGRHLGGPSDPPVRITATIDDRQVAQFDASPGYFLEFLPVPAGALDGDGRYARLAVTASSAGGTVPRVGLEQFNLQDPDRGQFGFDDGWLEPEYNPQTARSWRWMTESATLQVHHAGRDVMLTLHGESPLRYFDHPPTLRIVVGGTTVAEMRPDRDFTLEAKIPAAVLEQSGGRIAVQSSEFFIPGDRDGSADRRHLALRIYAVTVRAN